MAVCLRAHCSCDTIRFGEYGLHDLVVLDQQTMGVIVAIHATTCKVLTNQVRLARALACLHWPAASWPVSPIESYAGPKQLPFHNV